MIKTVVIPKGNKLLLSIPNDYIGKEVEVLVYAKDELKEEKSDKKVDIARFKGLLSKEEGEKFSKYLEEVRNEWDRDI
jgi:hypothetical protein